MNLFKRRKSKSSQAGEAHLIEPGDLPQPQTAADYLRRGYAYYARSQFHEAIQDYQAAVSLEPDMVDAVYALGMAFKASRNSEESVQTFRQVLSLLNGGAVADRVRADMLRRLALGHINEISLGDWNLEKEIWHRVE